MGESVNPQIYILDGKDAAADARIRANLHAFLERLPADKAWRVEIHPHREARSKQQRKALFGVAEKAIMEHMGLQGSREQQQLHTYLCGEYFGWKEDALGRKVPERTTTTNERGEREEIDRERAADMYSFIQRLAAEHGIDVPDPDPEMRSGY
jgi:hypothetical protein